MTEKDNIATGLARLNSGELSPEDQQSMAMLVINNGTAADAISALPNVTDSDAASELAVFIWEKGTSGDVPAAINALPNVTHRDAASALAWFICDNGTQGNVGAVNALLEQTDMQLTTRTRQKLVSFVEDKTTGRKPIPGTLRQQVPVPGIPRRTGPGNKGIA